MSGREVIFRAALYVAIAILTPIAALYVEGAAAGVWPATLAVVAALLSGAVQALVALRAFFDGSNERYKSERGGAQ